MSSSKPCTTYSFFAIPLRKPILDITAKVYQSHLDITLLAPQIPQLLPLETRQSSAMVRINKAYAEVCAGKLPLPEAEAIISSLTREIEDIAEEVDDYIIFWREGGDVVVDGEPLGWNFVRHGGERGELARQRKRILAEWIVERVRKGGKRQSGEESESQEGSSKREEEK